MNNKYVFTGGPGSGKTTILSALAERGYRVEPETARRIIKTRLTAGLSPRPDPTSFAQEILRVDIDNYRAGSKDDAVTFFDRGVMDALYMLSVQNALNRNKAANYVQAFPYNNTVFLFPPWKDIYRKDAERDQSFDQSVAVFEGMKSWYSQWGYDILEVPRGRVNERIAYILAAVENDVSMSQRHSLNRGFAKGVRDD